MESKAEVPEKAEQGSKPGRYKVGKIPLIKAVKRSEPKVFFSCQQKTSN
jgi:hypothetical protein